MSDGTYRPRLSVELTIEQKDRLDNTVGRVHGLQKAFFSVLIDDLLDILEGPQGTMFISAFLHRQITLSDILLNEEPEHGGPTSTP